MGKEGPARAGSLYMLSGDALRGARRVVCEAGTQHGRTPLQRGVWEHFVVPRITQRRRRLQSMTTAGAVGACAIRSSTGCSMFLHPRAGLVVVEARHSLR